MELIKRLLMALFFIPTILLIFFTGGIVLSSFLSLVVLALMFELREIFIEKGINVPRVVLIMGILIFFMSAYFSLFHMFASLVLVFIVVTGIDILLSRITGSFNRVSASIFFCVYISVFMSSLFRIRMLDNGGFLLFSLIGMIWLTDSAAYFAGRYLGKHRNVFSVSPNKSAEGFIAGILMSFVASFIFGYFGNYTILQSLSLAVSVGIFGQFGDLFESMLKRDAGVKDSSHFLPGHGGVLDRFDSLLLAAPVFYILLNLI
ncbi:MAG: phosphatidate cytidylyltransferase [Candidatus Cloacimonetes bacterium]|nr:phosphatidate cytidylyltransferase [Candidatus Cloacimonadota bacterium]MCF7814469.1 phosphatidate cytidylyltransferase [Candidatus Cloacimonadota bacterium]MCF7869044.1 phosphatidate cytidylyltransferase [Candidatus Cloacimonadota bacterium]MCF7884439.1 phosphatidate cytidylyltransferase [Candidatus Cloacimonadota bacterium]